MPSLTTPYILGQREYEVAETNLFPVKQGNNNRSVGGVRDIILLHLRMEIDWICMKSYSDCTFYHILNRIRIWIRIFSDMNEKQIPRIHILI